LEKRKVGERTKRKKVKKEKKKKRRKKKKRKKTKLLHDRSPVAPGVGPEKENA
jgi:hypothetical protein